MVPSYHNNIKKKFHLLYFQMLYSRQKQFYKIYLDDNLTLKPILGKLIKISEILNHFQYFRYKIVILSAKDINIEILEGFL